MKTEDRITGQVIHCTGFGETCESIKTTPQGKSGTREALLSHLSTDPRILWDIKGSRSASGKLPMGKNAGLAPGAIAQSRSAVDAWICGGMKHA
jgi:hypothetical protein